MFRSLRISHGEFRFPGSEKLGPERNFPIFRNFRPTSRGTPKISEWNSGKCLFHSLPNTRFPEFLVEWKALLNLYILCQFFNVKFSFVKQLGYFSFLGNCNFLWLIGNRTSCRPIRSVIILMINKSDSRCAVVWFCYHSYDYRPHWTPLSPLPLLITGFRVQFGINKHE